MKKSKKKTMKIVIRERQRLMQKKKYKNKKMLLLLPPRTIQKESTRRYFFLWSLLLLRGIKEHVQFYNEYLFFFYFVLHTCFVINEFFLIQFLILFCCSCFWGIYTKYNPIQSFSLQIKT